jgi:hypothetical protein
LQSHVLDQVAAIDLVREMMISTGEEVEVRKYKRLTELIIEVTFWCIFLSISHIGECGTVRVQFILMVRQCFGAGPDPTFLWRSESGLQQGFLSMF